MYQLVRAVAKPIHNDGRWADVDIGDLRLMDIYRQYSAVYAIIKDEFMVKPGSLDLSVIRDKLVSSPLTFNQFLLANGNKTLPVTDYLPTIKANYVKYEDGFRAGYSIKPVAPGASPDANYPLADRTNLFLSHPSVDFKLFDKHALVSVNGYYHIVDADKTGAVVTDGMATCRNSGENALGIYSFLNVSSLTCYPIKASMISHTVTDNPYRYGVVIDTGVDISKKGVFLVLGGYLIAMENSVLKRINDRHVFVSLQNIPIIERYHESRDALDYSLLPFEKNADEGSLINQADFLSDENLLGYLTMSQSFLVILDKPDVYLETEEFHVLPGKGRGVAYVRPTLPLRVGYGRMAEYWKVHEDGQWSVTLPSTERETRRYQSIPRSYNGNLNAARDGQQPVKRPALWLKIGCDI